MRLLSRSTGLRTRNAKPKEQAFPSEGASSPPPALVTGQKRKRDDKYVSTMGNRDELSPEQVRQTQKQHKIRIVNLQKIRKSSQDSETPRKRVKEEARMFPQPLMKFFQLRSRYNVSNALISNVADQGYYEPTGVQIAALPLLLDDIGNSPHLLTVAPTGSGKTLAFLLPLIEKLRLQRAQVRDGSNDSRSIRALILAPTKELVGQIVNEGRKLGSGTGISITAMRKGMKLAEEQNGLSSAPSSEDEDKAGELAPMRDLVKSDILVSTPLSLLHAISSENEIPIPLPAIETLILDEADVLLDPLFREQTLSIWSALTSSRLRTSFWSATVGSNIEELAVKTITERQRNLVIKEPSSIVRIVVGLKDSSLPSISHKLIYAATEPGKLLGLRQLLHPQQKSVISSKANATQSPMLRPPFLIFTQTIERATALFNELQYDVPAAAGGSSRIAVLHSSLSTTARSAIMTKFRKGEIWILITTDLLSRGVDFKGINGVVNYDIPTTSAAYVHRAGRTGRAGRSGGICVTLYTREDIKYLKAVASVIQASQQSDKSAGGSKKIDLGLEKWILDALPELSRKDRHLLKERGVETRRAIKESDDAKQRKLKRKSRIGTKSGYERQLESRRQGAVQGSLRRKMHAQDETADELEDEWGGFE